MQTTYTRIYIVVRLHLALSPEVNYHLNNS